MKRLLVGMAAALFLLGGATFARAQASDPSNFQLTAQEQAVIDAAQKQNDAGLNAIVQKGNADAVAQNAQISNAIGQACTNSADGSTNDCPNELVCLPDVPGGKGKCDLPTSDTSSAVPASASTAAPNTPTDINRSANDAYDGLMTKILALFAWLLGIAGITLENAVFYTVVKMGSYVNDLSAVGVAWRIFRDIGNIVLIFGFIAIGISTILGVESYGSTKTLPKLLICAVLLNFSLFAAEAVVDVGNLFATEFYTQIRGGQATLSPVSYSHDNIKGEGISNAVMNQLGLQTIYGEALKPASPVLHTGNVWIVGFFGILLFLTASFVFFSLAFILIARFVVLVLVIIAAPIGIAGLAIPKLDGYAKQWWGMLIKQTITAPILFLLLYVALAVITDAKFLTGFGATGTSTEASNAASVAYLAFLNGGNADLSAMGGMLLSFFVAMGLLMAVTMAAKSLGAAGSELALKIGSAASFGAAAYGMSLPLNYGSWAGRKLVQRLPNSGATRAAAWVFRKGERARMDIRSVPGVSTGLKAGGAGEGAEPVGKSARGRLLQAQDWWNKGVDESNREFGQETRIPNLRSAVNSNNAGDIGRIIGNLSDKDLESREILGLIRGSATAAAALPQARFDKLMTGETLSDAQKVQLRDLRTAGIRARFTNGDEFRHPADHQNPALRNQTVPSIHNPGANMTRGEYAARNLTNEAASQLPDVVLTTPAVYENLNNRQLEAIRRAGRIDDASAATIGAYLQNSRQYIDYWNTRNIQQQRDLDEFWHTNLGGNQGGGPAAPQQGGGGAAQPAAPAAPAGGQGGGRQGPYRPPGGVPPRARPIGPGNP